MRGNKKSIGQATHFLEAFDAATEENVDAVIRSVNMLREAKGHKRIDKFIIHASAGQEGGEERVMYVVDAFQGGSPYIDDDDFSRRALKVSASANDPIKLPELVRRILRSVEELKPLVARCDAINVKFGLCLPVVPMGDGHLGRWEANCYAEIDDIDD